MVRTTLNLKAEVLAELKRRARKQRRPLGDVASDVLESGLRAQAAGRMWPPEGWVVRDLGARLSDWHETLDFLDRERYGDARGRND